MVAWNGAGHMSDRPGLMLRAVGGAIGIAKAVARIEPAEPAEVARRITICEACPSGCYLERPSRCDLAKGGCGCFLSAKWRIASERCPKQHW